MKRHIRYRPLVILLAALVLGAGAVFRLHAWQMRRHARTLMAQARQAEAEGRLDRASLYLHRYLVFAPGDNAARTRYGEMTEQFATSDHERWRAVSVYEQVLRGEPSRHDIRRRLALLAMRLGWISEAHHHLQILVRERPGQGDLECLLGQCQEEARDYPRAAASYQCALRDDPGQVEAYVRLARLFQYRLDQPEKVRRVLDDLVKNNSASAMAYLARAGQRMNRGLLVEAGRDMDRARELAPDDALVLLAAADLARRRGRFDEARRYLRHGREHDPRNLAMHLDLASLELQCADQSAAIDCLRQALVALPAQPDLLLLLGETLIDRGEESAAEELIQAFHRPGSPPGAAHYLTGRLQRKRKQWPQALRTLAEVAQSPESAPRLASRASLALGQCHEQLGASDRRLTALEKAVALDELSAPARLALAAALRDMGRIAEALEQYREVVQLPQAPEESWLLLGRLLMQRNRSLPPRKRRWTEVEKVLERAARSPILEVPLAVLQAEVLAERGRPEEARGLLEKTVAAHPGEAELWTTLADLALRQGQSVQSARVLESVPRHLSYKPELLRARIALCLSRPPRQACRTLRTLENELEHLPADERVHPLAQVVSAYFRIGEREEGQRLCRQIAERRPADLRYRLVLLDLALQGGDAALLARLTADVRRLEGEEGTWWRYGEAARLLLAARQSDSLGREQARALAADIVRRRPDWPHVALLEAYLHEQEGRSAAAADAYLRAFHGGERRPGLAEHLVHLLAEQGRLDEADEVIRKFEQQATPLAELARMGAEIALRQRGNEWASELARRAVPNDSSDYQALIWLGQVLSLAGRPVEGEEALRRAVRQRGDLAETWLALVAHLCAFEQVRDAEGVREEMRRHLPADQAPLALAVCAEVLDRLDEAERYYRQALARTPNDGAALQRAARFYLRLNRTEQAEPLLRRMLAPETDVSAANQTWARRQLALLLAFERGDSGYRLARALLDENPRPAVDAVFDRRARLFIQGTRAEERSMAVRLLEESSKVQPFAAEELFYLVRLHEMGGAEDAARERRLDLLALDRNNPEYLDHHINRLLQRGRKDEARPWIVRLQK